MFVALDNQEAQVMAGIPLNRAHLCLDCKVISEKDLTVASGELGCGSCGGRELFPIAAWLDRDEQNQEERAA